MCTQLVLAASVQGSRFACRRAARHLCVLRPPPAPPFLVVSRNGAARAPRLSDFVLFTVHGDIKPANMMLSGGASGACVLIDLGTARAVGAAFSEGSLFALSEPRLAGHAAIICIPFPTHAYLLSPAREGG